MKQNLNGVLVVLQPNQRPYGFYNFDFINDDVSNNSNYEVHAKLA